MTEIDARYTTLEHDDQVLLIPNSTLFTNPIVVRKAEAGRHAAGAT